MQGGSAQNRCEVATPRCKKVEKQAQPHACCSGAEVAREFAGQRRHGRGLPRGRRSCESSPANGLQRSIFGFAACRDQGPCVPWPICEAANPAKTVFSGADFRETFRVSLSPLQVRKPPSVREEKAHRAHADRAGARWAGHGCTGRTGRWFPSAAAARSSRRW